MRTITQNRISKDKTFADTDKIRKEQKCEYKEEHK
jgi:hypothetical protein